jgi:hypothetical protein
MTAAEGSIQFTLQPASPLPAIAVRMRRFGERWVAEAETDMPNVGVALSPREALTAALSPLGEVIVRALLADLSLLEPSCQIIELERVDTA